MEIIRTLKDKILIETEEDWYNWCKIIEGREWNEKKWEYGHSMRETARFWLGYKDSLEFIRDPISSLLGKDDFEFSIGIPEYSIEFDKYKSGNRRHDFLIVDSSFETLLTVEAKSLEPIGKKFNEELHDAIDRKNRMAIMGEKSYKLDRLIDLYDFFDRNEKLLTIQYQLLYWFFASVSDKNFPNTKNIFMILQDFIDDNISGIYEYGGQKYDYRLQKDLQFIGICEFTKFISENKIIDILKDNINGPINNKYTKGKDLYIYYMTVKL